MSGKRFLVDGEPKSMSELIHLAKEYDPDFGADGLCLTSEAAAILRRFSIEVGYNPDCAGGPR